MIILRQGDRLPAVAVAQSFMNQHGHSSEFIEVDGIFGPQTRRGVIDFERGTGRGATGLIDGDRWHDMVGRQWQVMDSVDLTDFDDPRHRIEDDVDLLPYGQTIIRNYGQSSGSPGVILEIRSRATAGSVVLLRFHGHGGPGNMIVASGREGNRGSSLNSGYGPRFYDALRSLAPIFAPFGSVEMHGCRVGSGSAGRALLLGMADAMGVPVSAGTRSQYGGGQSTFRFEGPVLTVCPGGMALKEWAQRRCQVSLAA